MKGSDSSFDAHADYRDFVELNPQVPWTASPAGDVLDFNQRWLDLTGLTREQALGSGWTEVTHPDDLGRMTAAWAEVVVTGDPYDIEHRIRTADGSHRWMRTRAYAKRGPDGSIFRWYGFTEDIDDRKHLEQRLLEQERRLRDDLAELEAIYRTAPVGLGVLDRDLRFRRINQRLASINGRTVEEHLGRTVREMVPDLSSEGEQALRDVLNTGEPQIDLQLVGETVAQPGVKRTWLEQWHPIRDEAGQVCSISVVTEDITELKRMERELVEADRSKDEFLAMLAHELRNPLAPLTAALQLLETSGSLDERDRRLVAVAARQAGRFGRLVDDLLDIARIVRGEVPMCYERVGLDTIVRQAADSVEEEIRKRGHCLSIDLPPDRVEIVADPVRLAQVLHNLLLNACKYTPDAGHIHLELRGTPEFAQVRVSDDGIGIEPGQLESVFELFRQIPPAGPGERVDGLGVGLAMVKRLVELHGGSVLATSAGAGLGATFTVRMPYEPTATGAPSTAR